MTLSKDDLIKRKDELASNIEILQKDIVASENQIKTLRNNLNAMAGALQQVDMFLKQIEDKGEPMPPEKKLALDMATS
tara:strand:- start:734 stop:967 length:234 start_codon:yes stop_codon:yes gene_type:complete